MRKETATKNQDTKFYLGVINETDKTRYEVIN
jgi:hypothetical protein